MRSTMKKTMGAALLMAALQVTPAGAQLPVRERVAVQEEMARAQAELAAAQAHVPYLRQSLEQSREALAQSREAMEQSRESLGSLAGLEALGSLGRMSELTALAEMGGVARGISSSRMSRTAPAPWIQEDPGAKAYAAARDALNARRYQEAAEAFAKLRQSYPKSGYVADSFYWQAFALYRQGGSSQYKRAVELLRAQMSQHPNASTRSDAEELQVRLEAQLARQGDARAAESITRQASDPCGGEEQEVRAAALSALLTMNAEQAMPILKQVLQKRDQCSAELRRQAVFLISQKMTDESVDILLDLAHRNPDPDPEVREQAVFWLSQVKSDEALDALLSILKESKDRDVQEKAIFAISQHGSDRAVAALRQFAERADAPKDLRENAIFWIGQNPKAGGTKYLMDLYPRLGDPDLKEKAIFAISQGRSAEARTWLLDRAKDRSENVEVRKKALFWAGQAGDLSMSELKSMYTTLDDQEMKEQVIFVASQRRGTEGVDFLMDVAKNEKDPDLRKKAVFWLGQSKDPRVAEFLLSLIGQ